MIKKGARESAIFHVTRFSHKTRTHPTWPKGLTDSSAVRFIFSAEFQSTTMVVHDFPLRPPTYALENITRASHGKWETRFPNHVINRGSQQSGSPSATSVEKSCHENRHKTVQSNRRSSGNNLFVLGHESQHAISAFLSVSFDKRVFRNSKTNRWYFYLGNARSDVALWYTRAYIYTSLGKARVNLDSSSFRCSVANPFDVTSQFRYTNSFLSS